jgi:hypothetical protein
LQQLAHFDNSLDTQQLQTCSPKIKAVAWQLVATLNSSKVKE